jgi:hypothetical protein
MRSMLIVSLAVLAVLLFACAPQEQAEKAEMKEKPEEQEKAKEEEAPPDLSAEAAKYWTEELKVKYAEWRLVADMLESAAPEPPHGVKVNIYFNEAAAKAKDDDADVMPDGAVIVKEGFNEDGTLKHYALMKKAEGKWFWAVYNPDDTVMMAAFAGTEEAKMCDGCHSVGRDMVATWPKK